MLYDNYIIRYIMFFWNLWRDAKKLENLLFDRRRPREIGTRVSRARSLKRSMIPSDWFLTRNSTRRCGAWPSRRPNSRIRSMLDSPLESPEFPISFDLRLCQSFIAPFHQNRSRQRSNPAGNTSPRGFRASEFTSPSLAEFTMSWKSHA